MRQLLYVSSSPKPMARVELDRILAISRSNNASRGVTGLLWTDGRRFLQVLEGADHAVATTLERIRQDPRHRALVVLHDRAIVERTFGAWDMALMSDRDAGMAEALAGASPDIRGTFEGFAATRRAA